MFLFVVLINYSFGFLCCYYYILTTSEVGFIFFLANFSPLIWQVLDAYGNHIEEGVELHFQVDGLSFVDLIGSMRKVSSVGIVFAFFFILSFPMSILFSPSILANICFKYLLIV